MALAAATLAPIFSTLVHCIPLHTAGGRMLSRKISSFLEIILELQFSAAGIGGAGRNGGRYGVD
jgi:hypothetical protein